MDNRLENLLKNKNCYFIHYASDGFYNGMTPTPRISCIGIFNNSMDVRKVFSIDTYFQSHSVEDSEKFLLQEFKSFIESRPDISFIHWNMNGKGFGFKALWARAEELGINLPEIQEENLFDLASYVAYLSEKRLSIKQILWFNSLLDRQYLDGKDEALYFSQRKFCEITDSVSLKVVGLSYVVEEIKNGTLHTEKPFADPCDGLTKEERHSRALERDAAREEMLRDIVNHNKLALQKQQKALDEFIARSNSKGDKTIDNCLNDFDNKYKKKNSEFINRHFDKLESQAERYESEYEVEEDGGLFFFDFGHPLISLFANWFANR
ncbi:hypothetical protein IKQ21_00375 [bacterium]|nr:hypothetical protein [bacterium]